MQRDRPQNGPRNDDLQIPKAPGARNEASLKTDQDLDQRLPEASLRRQSPNSLPIKPAVITGKAANSIALSETDRAHRAAQLSPEARSNQQMLDVRSKVSTHQVQAGRIDGLIQKAGDLGIGHFRLEYAVGEIRGIAQGRIDELTKAFSSPTTGVRG